MNKLRQYTALLLEGNGKFRRAGHIIDIFLIGLILINVVAIVLGRVDLCGMKNKQHEDKV